MSTRLLTVALRLAARRCVLRLSVVSTRLWGAFLPSVYVAVFSQLADEATTQKWVDEAIASADAKGPSDMGKVLQYFPLFFIFTFARLGGNYSKQLFPYFVKESASMTPFTCWGTKPVQHKTEL